MREEAQRTLWPQSEHRPPSSTGEDHRDSDHDVVDEIRTASIHASLATLLLSEKFSDMIIRCGGREFKAHRAIICSQSSFFDRAFTVNFKVGTLWSESYDFQKRSSPLAT